MDPVIAGRSGFAGVGVPGRGWVCTVAAFAMRGHETRPNTDEAGVFFQGPKTRAARRLDTLSVGFPLRCSGPVHHQFSRLVPHRLSGPRVAPDGAFRYFFLGHVVGTRIWIGVVKIRGKVAEQLFASWVTCWWTTLAGRPRHRCRGNQTSQRGPPPG